MKKLTRRAQLLSEQGQIEAQMRLLSSRMTPGDALKIEYEQLVKELTAIKERKDRWRAILLDKVTVVAVVFLTLASNAAAELFKNRVTASDD